MTKPNGKPYLTAKPVQTCHNCDWLKGGEQVTLTWPADLWANWQAATRVRSDLEILAVFDVDDENHVTELTFPEQEVEAAACLLLKQDGQKAGQIHSHHKMGASFSSMDRETVLPNYRFAVVTNHDGNYEAVEKVTLPCGGIGWRPVKVAVEETATAAELREHILAVCKVKTHETKYTWPSEASATPGERADARAIGFQWDSRTSNVIDLEREAMELYDDEVPVCAKCEVYWETSTPDMCWFCQKPTQAKSMRTVALLDYCDADAAMQMEGGV